MKIIVKKTYEEISAIAADIFAAEINSKEAPIIGLATGSTPIGLYDCLVEKYEKGLVDFSNVRSVNLDEYYPITPDNDQSYRYFMNQYLFDRVNIDKKNTMVPDGTAKDAAKECGDYEAKIDTLGGIDVQILGIGRNGHIGFNEPDEALVPYTHLTALTESTIKANARFFASEDDVPKHALTMGIKSVFKARKIVVIASGKEKADAVRAMVEGSISTKCPASMLTLHPDVTLLCDEDAYSEVK